MWWQRVHKTLPVFIELSFQEIIFIQLAHSRYFEAKGAPSQSAAFNPKGPHAYPQIMVYPGKLSTWRRHD